MDKALILQVRAQEKIKNREEQHDVVGPPFFLRFERDSHPLDMFLLLAMGCSLILGSQIATLKHYKWKTPRNGC